MEYFWEEMKKETLEIAKAHETFSSKISSEIESSISNFIPNDHQWSQLPIVIFFFFPLLYYIFIFSYFFLKKNTLGSSTS